jgi:hypothetical protein
MSLTPFSTQEVLNTFGDTITIIEPHHDDFCLDCFGTMFLLDQEKLLKKLKIITVFGISPGCSKAPTGTLRYFFKNCEFDSLEFLKPNLFWGGHADRRKEQAENCESFEKQYEIRTGESWEWFSKGLEKLYEGTVLLPMGFKHADHNLLARLPGNYYYREYPYWWHKQEDYKKESSLYIYPSLSEYFEVQFTKEQRDYKWKVFRTVYADVQGQFNPKFGSARPYFGSVDTEAFYKKI